MSGGLGDVLRQYLSRSGEGVMRGVRSANEAINPWQYVTPKDAAGFLPGAGFVQGAQDAQSAKQAFQAGNYGQAVGYGAQSLLNTGLEALPLTAALPAVSMMNRAADLPMDEASRMARAKEMGFTEDVYHGTVTKHDIQDFDRKTPYGKRVESYVAPEQYRDFSNGFAEGQQGRVYPLKINRDGFLDSRNQADREALENILAERGIVKGLDWNYAPREGGDPVLPGWGNQSVINAVNEAGYPGMVIQERPWMESYAVFDPSRLRSRFAAFDPAKKNSSNILASGVGMGLPAILAAQALRDENQ